MALDGSKFKLITGLPGSGKSLMMSTFVYPYLIAGYQVYSNLWLNWKRSDGVGEWDTKKNNLHYYQEIEDIIDVRNCIVICDEIAEPLDPRNWENEGSGVRRFFQQHRHHHIDIYGTTQNITLVAKSARIVIDEWTDCFRILTFIPGVIILRERHIDRSQMLKEEPEPKDNGLFSWLSEIRMFLKTRLTYRKWDNYKAEIEHKFCEKCHERQDFNLDKCPKCGHDLKIKISGIYDSCYDIQLRPKKHYWKPVSICKTCGHEERGGYKGKLSSEEFLKQQSLTIRK